MLGASVKVGGGKEHLIYLFNARFSGFIRAKKK